MARRIILRLELSQLFPKEKGKKLEDFLKGVSRERVIKSGSYFTGFAKGQAVVRNNVDLLNKWFSPDNRPFAFEILKAIYLLKRQGIESTIVNIHTSLRLIEQGLNHQSDDTMDSLEFEKNIFKAYVLLNETDNEKDIGIFQSLEKQQDDIKFPLMVLTQSFRYSDISVVNYREVLAEQFLKAALFFKFIESLHPKILEEFLKYYKVATWRGYLEKIFLLVKLCTANNKKSGFTEITIKKDQHYEENVEFIEKLSFTSESEEMKLSDFVSLRSKPLIKIKDNSYRLIYDLFVLEKVFNSIFFVLKEIPALNKLNLKEIFTYQFSEKVLLYQILNKVFSHSDVRFTGEQLDKMRVSGAPDYYVRRSKKVLLFESKDIVLNADLKESTSYTLYEEQIRKKLYYDVQDGKKKPKAVLQLISNVFKVIQDQNPFDHATKGERIYPIIVVHHRQLNVGGLNHLLKKWFMEELENLKNSGLETKRVAQLTVLNIASLIYFSDELSTRKHSLEGLIELYHRQTSLRHKKTVTSYNDLESTLIKRTEPFNLFIAKRIKSKGMPSVLMKNAREVFKKKKSNIR